MCKCGMKNCNCCGPSGKKDQPKEKPFGTGGRPGSSDNRDRNNNNREREGEKKKW